MIGRHKQDFEKTYSYLSGLDLNIDFPLIEIERFHWRRGEWNDGYYSYHYRRFTSHILSRLQLAEGQSVLVVGCGFGFDEKNIKSLFPDIDLWSIDISEEMMKLAVASRSPGRFALAVAENLPFPDYAFDRVLAREVIEHVISSRTMLKEIHRVLRPGGIAVVTTENEESLGPTNYYDFRLRERLADLLNFPLPSPEYRDQAPSLGEIKGMIGEVNLVLSEYFWDGALYKYLIEISPWVRSRMSQLAHFFSCLENHRILANLFCDQIKYVLRKGDEGSIGDPPPRAYYACIDCGSRLLREDGHHACPECRHEYPVKNDIVNFIPERMPEGIGESVTSAVGQAGAAGSSKIGRRLFPKVNRIARALYCGTYLAMALLATLFVKRNRNASSGLLSPDDPYQKYLTMPSI